MNPSYVLTDGVTSLFVSPVNNSVSNVVYPEPFKFCFLCSTLYAVSFLEVYTGLIVVLPFTIIVLGLVVSPSLHPSKSYPRFSFASIVISVPYG